MGQQTKLKIGELAKASELAVGALRYYESLGLIQSERGKNGYRYYEPRMLHQLLFIKKAQSLGFSLNDIAEMITLHEGGDRPCHFVQARLQHKIDQLDQQIQEMTAFKSHLEDYRDRWQGLVTESLPSQICPLIESLPDDPTQKRTSSQEDDVLNRRDAST